VKTADRNLKIFTENIEEDLKILEHIKMGIKADTQAPNIETRDISRRKFEAIEHILSDYKRVLKENEEYKKFLEKTIKEYIPDYKLEELVNRYKNESFIPRVEVKKILEDRRK
jgi:hypothetical protein